MFGENALSACFRLCPLKINDLPLTANTQLNYSGNDMSASRSYHISFTTRYSSVLVIYVVIYCVYVASHRSYYRLSSSTEVFKFI